MLRKQVHMSDNSTQSTGLWCLPLPDLLGNGGGGTQVTSDTVSWNLKSPEAQGHQGAVMVIPEGVPDVLVAETRQRILTLEVPAV